MSFCKQYPITNVAAVITIPKRIPSATCFSPQMLRMQKEKTNILNRTLALFAQAITSSRDIPISGWLYGAQNQIMKMDMEKLTSANTVFRTGKTFKKKISHITEPKVHAATDFA